MRKWTTVTGGTECWLLGERRSRRRRVLRRQDLVMRLEYAAGERMFVDFAADAVPNSMQARGQHSTHASLA
jgi:hypothetical protein